MKNIFKGAHILASLLLLAQISNAQPGFLSIEDAHISASVKVEGRKTLEIWGPGITVQNLGDRILQYEYVVYPKDYDSKVSELLRSSDEDFRSKMTTKINLAELANCKRAGFSLCHLTTIPFRGSAFVLGKNTLVTVSHNFSMEGYGLEKTFKSLSEHWVEEIESSPSGKAKALAEIANFKRQPLDRIIFFLTDVNGNIVFDSTQQSYSFTRYRDQTNISGTVDLSECPLADEHPAKKAYCYIISTSVSSSIAADIKTEENYFQTTSNDIAVVTLSSNLPSIPVAQTACKAGDKNFIVGYPMKTEQRDKIGGRNAVDRQLSVTEGIMLDDAGLRGRSDGLSFIDPFIKFNNQDKRPLIFSDADSTLGMSGGVIMNQDGTVCGVESMGYPDDVDEIHNANNTNDRGVLQKYSVGIGISVIEK